MQETYVGQKRHDINVAENTRGGNPDKKTRCNLCNNDIKLSNCVPERKVCEHSSHDDLKGDKHWNFLSQCLSPLRSSWLLCSHTFLSGTQLDSFMSLLQRLQRVFLSGFPPPLVFSATLISCRFCPIFVY